MTIRGFLLGVILILVAFVVVLGIACGWQLLRPELKLGSARPSTPIQCGYLEDPACTPTPKDATP